MAGLTNKVTLLPASHLWQQLAASAPSPEAEPIAPQVAACAIPGDSRVRYRLAPAIWFYGYFENCHLGC